MNNPKYKSGVIAVIRTDNPEFALNLSRGFASTQISAIEVTMTVPNALDIVRTLIDEGIERVGVGTIRRVEDIKTAKKIGAEFIVSPHLEEALVKTAVELGLSITPGILTPSELVQAINWGASSAKVFPVGLVGGQTYIQTILEPIPDARLVVSGGIQPEEVQSYLNIGCVGVCMGGALWEQQIVATGIISSITAFAEAALSRM
jgi:2-dehydro-3-deoxyphosphogluconate aldolase/(4S)-4-hydroxy-2-oxoglutarate aldolase